MEKRMTEKIIVKPYDNLHCDIALEGIETTRQELLEIGVSKQFDLENMAIIDYTPQVDIMERMSYEDLVVKYIREKYSIDDECAILRKNFVYAQENGGNSTEFVEYNDYVEKCKAKAKQEVNV